MIFPNDFESRLGFERIRQMIHDNCSTELAKTIAKEQKFSTDFTRVQRSLLQTWQMVEALTKYEDFPASGYVDTNHFIRKIGIEGMFLEPTELLSLRRAMELSDELRRFFDDKEELDRLKVLGEKIGSFKLEMRTINQIIDEFAKVKDSASPELSRIRSEMVSKEREVGRKLQSILRLAQNDGIVEEDASLSMRDGRLVIPVAAQNKRKIRGFVHDESATGKTAYIEPVEVVELNNAIKELEAQEKREVRKILTDITLSFFPRKREIESLSHYLSFVDFLKAKALLAIKIDGVMPNISQERQIELWTARHPLLEMALKKEGKAIVPLNLTLDKNKHILVISGPNAGGKSVCLKSVGLLQYMLQCGVLPSVADNSTFSLFDNIFIDIGDQQSLDNDLSTYSSHLQNMKNILRYGDKRSLVLIDEFGTGTEPTMGGAIAESILEKMEEKGMFAVITTHYTNLKYYADKSKVVVNGAMTFDVKNILPLFKLEIGRPGSSFALEIAQKIGLPGEIIACAKSKIGDGQVSLEKQLREVARDKRYWESKRDKIRVAEKRADELAATYEKDLEELKSRKNAMIREAKDEAAKILGGANKLIENTIFEIRKSQADKERTKEVRKQVEEFSEQMESSDSDKNLAIEKKIEQLRARQQRRKQRTAQKNEMREIVSQIAQTPKTRSIVVGDDVRIKGQSVIGKVNSIKGKRADVHFGSISTMIEVEKLELVAKVVAKSAAIEQKINSSAPKIGYDAHQKRLDFSQQIDLRGYRVDEAMMKAQEFVDEAYMLGFKEVKILHGKGTGALKEQIRLLLKTLPFVSSLRDEHEQFGGAGITIVNIE
ncbi:MAG: Smr/MutS family protein [Rikenellaceae bacterium]